MDLILLILGVGLAGAAITDAIITTLVPSGGGPITAFLSEHTWRLLLRAHDPDDARSHRLLRTAGPLILLMIFAVWVVLLWSGWALIFSADAGAVTDSSTGNPVDAWGRVYFAGYTLFTLGIGNYVPAAGPWEVVTSMASLNGLFLVTLSITYLLPVVSAATGMQQLASLISDIGHTPYDIVLKHWDGRQITSLSTLTSTILPLLELHTQQHTSYPVLHYFHSASRRTAIGPAVAALDEAVLMLRSGVRADATSAALELSMLEEALYGLILTFRSEYAHGAQAPPPAPSLELLRGAGIPTVGDADFSECVARRSAHRTNLLGFVRTDGWTWDSVVPER